MRLRVLGAAAVAVLAAATLSACRTNVGVAADIDGRQVSESDVSSYVTSAAQPVAISATSTTPARVFVLDVLILRPYFKKLLSASPVVGHVSERKLAAAHQAQLDGKSDKSVAAQIGVHGYSTAFDKLVVDLSVLLGVRSHVMPAQLAAAGAKIAFPVTLNPRYGTWTRKGLFIDTSASAGTPGFLTLQPTGASGS